MDPEQNAASTQETGNVRWIRCPGCQGPSRYAVDNRYRPFCSAVCQNADWSRWATEAFFVESNDPENLGQNQP